MKTIKKILGKIIYAIGYVFSWLGFLYGAILYFMFVAPVRYFEKNMLWTKFRAK